MAPHGRSGIPESALPNSLFICMSLVVAAWLVWDGLNVPLVTYGAYSDYWEHSAALTEWLRNFSAPTNPHVVSEDLSPRFMPYFWLLTLAGRMMDLDAVQLMSISAVINYCLIIVGLQLFLRLYFHDVWAPLAGFFAIFMLWGIGWNWSNLFQLRSFFYVGGYPSSFVFGLSLISFWATLKLLRQDRSPIAYGLLLLVLAVLMLLCHPLTGVFGIVGCGLLALTDKNSSAGPRANTLLILVTACLLPELWPYFSVWKLMLGQYGGGVEQWTSIAELDPLERFNSGAWQHLFYNPSVMLMMLGPALLGIPVLAWLLIKRKHSFIVIGAFLMAIPYFANLFVPIPLAHRFLLFVVVYLQLALVWLLLNWLSTCRADPPPLFGKAALGALAALAVVIAGANFALLAGEYRGFSLSPDNFNVRDKRAMLPDGQNVVDVYRTLTEPLDSDAVVLTTAALGWPLPTVKGKVVSLYHENPMLLDQLERYQATGNFFYRPINNTKRAEIVTRYAVSHVLLSESDPELKPEVAAWLRRYGQLAASAGSYRMYALLDSVPKVMPAVVDDTELVAPTAPATAPKTDSSESPAGRSESAAAPTEVTSEPLKPVVVDRGQAAPTQAPGIGEAAPDLPEESEAASSFGAPIAEPIINLPKPASEEPAPRTAEEAAASTVVDTFGAPVEEAVSSDPDVNSSAPGAEAPEDAQDSNAQPEG